MAGDSDSAAVHGSTAHYTHRDFNERLGGGREHSGDLLMSGAWISSKDVSGPPKVRREFDMNRDPAIREQILDLKKSEAERRSGETGRGSTMVSKDKPQPVPRPHEQISRPVDRAAFRSQWLAEQQKAVMANAAPRESQSHDQPVRYRGPQEPSR